MTLEQVIRLEENNIKENDALSHIGNCVSMKEQLKRKPDFAITVIVNDLEFGICDNYKFIELLNNEILQAERCIAGEKNKFE
jgi:hypothetical protein